MNRNKITMWIAALICMIGVAPPHADASTSSRIKKLEQRMKKVEARAASAQAAANDAIQSYNDLVGCLIVVNVGAGEVLASSTTSTFVQGDSSLGLPDLFSWLPVPQIAVVAGGPDNMLLVDSACLTGSRASRGYAPRPLHLR